eukprot:3323859-Pleurochrysis_carterae.AAC.3
MPPSARGADCCCCRAVLKWSRVRRRWRTSTPRSSSRRTTCSSPSSQYLGACTAARSASDAVEGAEGRGEGALPAWAHVWSECTVVRTSALR